MIHTHEPAQRKIWASTAVLGVAAVGLFLHADDLSMWFDELWSLFQNSRPLEQIFRERELNWPLGYALVLHGWTAFAGQHDLAVHVLGALIGMIGVACMIQAGRALHSWQAGWLAGLLFGTSSYALYFFLEVRGYGLQLTGLAALAWLMARWVQSPTWRRAVPYALTQIGLLYTHFTSGLVIALTALYVLLALPRRMWWRWVAVMGAVGMAFLPLLPQFIDSYRLRSSGLRSGDLPSYFLKGWESIYRAYSAHQDTWFALVLIASEIGLAFWIARRRERAVPTLLWLIVWGVGIPVFAYLTRTTTGLFTTRYLSFTVPGALLLLGIGLASLPRRVWLAGVALVMVSLVFPWQPFDHRPIYSDAPPVRDFMREMAKRMRAGDVLVVDPSIDHQDYAWWYYEPLYMPGGILRAKDGRQGERVWYLTREGSEDLNLRATVERGRIKTEFWGPWYFIASLYEGPPLDTGISVGGLFTFRGSEISTGRHYMPGDRLTVETWWSVENRPPLDYSFGVFLINPGGVVVADSQSGPLGPNVPSQSSVWQPGRVYRDERTLEIPYCLAPGQYQVRLAVYYWEDLSLLPPVESEWTGPDNYLVLGSVFIDSFSYCEAR